MCHTHGYYSTVSCGMRSFMIAFLAKCYQGQWIKGDELGGAGGVNGWEYAYRVLVGRLVGKRPLGRPGYR